MGNAQGKGGKESEFNKLVNYRVQNCKENANLNLSFLLSHLSNGDWKIEESLESYVERLGFLFRF